MLGMWLGIALVVWLWGVALYLVVYYAALLILGAARLYELVGQVFYNAHVPLGGWRPALFGTIVFLGVFSIAAVSGRWIARVAELVSRRMRVSRRACTVGCNLALIAIATPLVHGCSRIIREHISHAPESRQDSDAPAATADDWTRKFVDGMQAPLTWYSLNTGLTREILLLGADGRYRRVWGGCSDGDLHEGRYDRKDDVIEIVPVASKVPDYAKLPNRLVEVRWGERRYLVADDAIMLRAFCNAVNTGHEPRKDQRGDFLLRNGDELLPAPGLPDVPGSAKQYLFAAPIEARTHELGADGLTRVDVGWEEGMREGLSLFAVDAPIPAEVQHLWGGATTYTQYLDVVRVEAHACWVREGVHRNWRVPAGLRVVSRDPHPPAAGW